LWQAYGACLDLASQAKALATVLRSIPNLRAMTTGPRPSCWRWSAFEATRW